MHLKAFNTYLTVYFSILASELYSKTKAYYVSTILYSKQLPLPVREAHTEVSILQGSAHLKTNIQCKHQN